MCLPPFSRYVGLCASIKMVALAIFAVDWWLVRRRKHMEYLPPLNTNQVVGSIISLDKCKFHVHMIDVNHKQTNCQYSLVSFV